MRYNTVQSVFVAGKTVSLSAYMCHFWSFKSSIEMSQIRV